MSKPKKGSRKSKEIRLVNGEVDETPWKDLPLRWWPMLIPDTDMPIEEYRELLTDPIDLWMLDNYLAYSFEKYLEGLDHIPKEWGK